MKKIYCISCGHGAPTVDAPNFCPSCGTSFKGLSKSSVIKELEPENPVDISELKYSISVVKPSSYSFGSLAKTDKTGYVRDAGNIAKGEDAQKQVQNRAAVKVIDAQE